MKKYLFLFASLALLAGCGDDEPVGPPDEPNLAGSVATSASYFATGEMTFDGEIFTLSEGNNTSSVSRRGSSNEFISIDCSLFTSDDDGGNRVYTRGIETGSIYLTGEPGDVTIRPQQIQISLWERLGE